MHGYGIRSGVGNGLWSWAWLLCGRRGDSWPSAGRINIIYQSSERVDNSKDGRNLNSFLQRGTEMVATGYCLYSVTMTMVLVLTLGSRVLGSTLEAIYAGSGQADAFANPPEYEDTGHGLYESVP